MNKILKKRILVIIVAVLLVAATATAVFLALRRGQEEPPQEGTEEKYDFKFYESSFEKLADPEDVGVMILDCDDTSSFRNLVNGYITRVQGEYVQGTGALRIGSLRKTSYASAFFRSTDISDYVDGSIHVSLFVSDTKDVGSALTLEISSSGTYDNEEISWDIPATILKSGWNELYLGIPDAHKTGEVKFEGLNFFRFRASESEVELELIMDNIYATHTEGVELGIREKAAKASTKAGYIMDCDTLDGLSANADCIMAVNESECKEGTGAIAVNGLESMAAYLEETDVSAYKDGNLCFWLYVNDKSYTQNTNLRVELTSGGTCDVEEITWTIQAASLKEGWNEISLNMLGGNKNGGNIDLTRVNFFRIWTNDAPKNLMLFLDAVHMEPGRTRVSTDGRILSMDSMSEMSVRGTTNLSITSAEGEYKEGTGALKGVFNNTVEIAVNILERVDISAWSKEALHFWLYVDDVSKLGGPLRVELGSAGTYDINEHQWTISTGALKNGWNDLTMSFSSASKSKDGGADFSKICWLRIYNIEKSKGAVTIIVDDVRAVKRIPLVREPGVILNCDSPEGIASGKYDGITTKTGEYKEGTGAFKTNNLSKDWFKFVLEDPVDISEYKKGQLHFWLYIEDTGVLSDNLRVELGSGGTYDVNELQWGIDYTTLKTGWNEIALDFANASVSKDGGADFSKINWFRIYWGKNIEGKYAILDDVRAVKKPEKEKVPGMILDCDSNEGLLVKDHDGVTTKEGEYKEGTGAFKTNNLSQDWFKFVLEDPVDISEYENDSLHFWLYIGDAGVLNDDLRVELGSSGKADVNELQWGVDYTTLKTGWNEITLDFAKASVSKDGGADFSKINWFRIWWKSNIEAKYAIVDDIRAVKKEQTEKEDVPGMILDCDSAEGIAAGKYGRVTARTGEYKEGTGAFKVVNPGAEWYKIQLQNPVDVSAYKDGELHFWLYVENVNILTDSIRVELGSAGVSDVNEHQWTFSKDSLKNGWNEVALSFSNASKSADGGADLSRVNWFRIYTQAVNGVTAIVDDIRAVKKEQPEKEDIPGMILDCDSAEGLSLADYDRITTGDGEYKEGTGAFRANNLSQDLFKFVLENPVDISAYKDGALHLWLYIEDASVLDDDFRVELGSAGKADVNELQWGVKYTTLETGWNEILLDFEDAGASKDGGADFSKINWFRIWWKRNIEAKYIILDDVRAVEKEVKGMILNCDSAGGLSLADYDRITTGDGEYKEGTGAFRTNNLSQDLFKFVLENPVDISAYKDGALHLWLYIEDASVLDDDFRVELGSAGKADVNELQWGVKYTTLETGWNEILLDFADAGASKDGGADFSKINWFRIWWKRNIEAKYAILDDVRAVE